MNSTDRIFTNADDFYPRCYICFEKYNIINSTTLCSNTPILINCGHTICYACFQSQKRSTNVYKSVEFKCHLCKNLYMINERDLHVNQQLIDYFSNFDSYCYSCHDILDSNNLPYFKQKMHQSNQRSDININGKFEDKLNVSESQNILNCRECAILQFEDNAQKNFIFSDVFAFKDKNKCKKMNCQKFYNLQLKYTCQCFIDDLNKTQKKNMIDTNNLEKVKNNMFHDMKYLFSMRNILQKEIELICDIVYRESFEISKLISKDIGDQFNKNLQDISLNSEVSILSRLDNQDFLQQKNLKNRIEFSIQTIFKNMLQELYIPVEQQKEMPIQKYYVQQDLIVLINNYKELYQKLNEQNEIVKRFYGKFEKINYKQILKHIDIQYQDVKMQHRFKWKKKIDSLIKNVFDHVYICIQPFESTRHKELQNYEDFVRRQLLYMYKHMSQKMQMNLCPKDDQDTKSLSSKIA